jgi:23S rRNA (cytidine2498-2'-O)-methyltransferase
MNQNSLSRHICITRPGQERYIIQEVRDCSPPVQCTEVSAGVVELSGCDAETIAALPPFFSQQLLPQALRVSAESIRSWAQLLLDALIAQLDDADETPLHLHIFSASSAERGEVFARARLIREETINLLKQKRRSIHKRLSEEATSEGPVVQLLLISNSIGYLSIAPSCQRARLGAALRPTVAGFQPVQDDKAPPSRAFKKLVEALTVFNIQAPAGARCVDLGASPGGWTHVLATRGCNVTAIDRSPLSPELMAHRRVTFIKGDAFTWRPDRPVSLMVCDVISAPQRSIELIDTWVAQKLCQALCVTVKFKGEPDFAALRSLRTILRNKTAHYDGKQLCHNKNELTVVAVLD